MSRLYFFPTTEVNDHFPLGSGCAKDPSTYPTRVILIGMAFVLQMARLDPMYIVNSPLTGGLGTWK